MSILFKLSICAAAIVLFSCSRENDYIAPQERKIDTTINSRPSRPIVNSEITIGNQIWMKKNLNVSRYRNGDIIPEVQDPNVWFSLTTGAWCYYNNDPAYGAIYGKLYNWYAVNDPRGLAPQGWRIPSTSNWQTLTAFLGGPGIAGGKMKSTSLWAAPNTGATDIVGFSALPAGRQLYYGVPAANLLGCTFWSATSSESYNANSIKLIHNSEGATYDAEDRAYGFSVRCVR